MFFGGNVDIFLEVIWTVCWRSCRYCVGTDVELWCCVEVVGDVGRCVDLSKL